MNSRPDITRFDRLASWLARELRADTVTLSDASIMSGGAIQENWSASMEVTGGAHQGCTRVVLRCDAPSALDASHDRDTEYRLLRHAYDGGVNVPRPLAYCADPGIFGHRVMVMQRVAGVAAGHKLAKMHDDAAGDRLVFDIGANLARLHSCAPYAGLDQSNPIKRRLAEFRRFLETHDSPQPVLDYAIAWMEKAAPDAVSDVPCHYDYRNGNILCQDGTVTSILDWEFAGNGDPHEDLGWFCAPCWRFGRPDREAGGIGSRAQFYAGYEAAGGAPIDDQKVRYWETVGVLRWAVIALAQTERFTKGGEQNLELALTGLMIPDLEAMLLDQLKEASW